MKATTEKMLNEIYQLSDNQAIKDMVLKIIRAEQSQTKGKFDYYKYVCKDELRPVMCGVYHDSGYKVATDTFLLVAIKEDYDMGELEGKTLLKDGTIIGQEKGRFPKWRDVIPNPKQQDYSRVEIDFDKWSEIYSTWKAEKKVGEQKEYVKVGPAYYKVELFHLFVAAMKRIGTSELFARSDRGGLARNGDDVALIMPVNLGWDAHYIL